MVILASTAANVPDSLPVVVGAFVTVIGAFLAIAKLMLSQATKDRESDRKERLQLSSAISLMAENSGKVAQATEKSANEAKERNGHLAELVLESSKTNQTLADNAINTIVAAVQNVEEQKVTHQTVENVDINKKEK